MKLSLILLSSLLLMVGCDSKHHAAIPVKINSVDVDSLNVDADALAAQRAAELEAERAVERARLKRELEDMEFERMLALQKEMLEAIAKEKNIGIVISISDTEQAILALQGFQQSNINNLQENGISFVAIGDVSKISVFKSDKRMFGLTFADNSTAAQMEKFYNNYFEVRKREIKSDTLVKYSKNSSDEGAIGIFIQGKKLLSTGEVDSIDGVILERVYYNGMKVWVKSHDMETLIGDLGDPDETGDEQALLVEIDEDALVLAKSRVIFLPSEELIEDEEY